MLKIKKEQLFKLDRKLSFFDFNQLDSDNKVVIHFDQNNIVYGDLFFGDQSTVYIYRKKLNAIKMFLEKLLVRLSDERSVIRKYDRKWLINKKDLRNCIKF